VKKEKEKGRENYPFKTEPMQHQYDFWVKKRSSRWNAELMDMGTGKTKLVIDEAAYMYDQGWINALLVFGNKGSYENWVEEIDLHLPDHVDRQIAIWRSSMNSKYSKMLDDLRRCKRMCMKILLMNIESLPFDRSFDLACRFARAHNTMTIVDESTHIKNPKAKRTIRAWKIRDISKSRRILTGSAVDNRPLDAWAQFEFLKIGCLGYTSYYAFRLRFAEIEEIHVKQKGKLKKVKTVVGYKNLDSLRSAIARFSVIIKKEDCLDLPPKVYERRYIELTADQKRIYNDIREKSISEIKEEKFATVKIALTKMLRLHQIVCGFLPDDEDKEIHKIPSNRLDAVKDIIDETDSKAIIWANYIPNFEELISVLQKEHGESKVIGYYGSTSNKDRERARREMKRGNKGELKYLVGNPQTGGYGLTLTGANLVIYYSNSFDGELRNQSEDRCHRIGQTAKVTYIDLIARDTIDEKILRVLKNKKSIADILTPSNWVDFFSK